MRGKKKQLLFGLVFGIVFGFLLQKGGVTRYDVIIGQLLLEDFTVVKIMMTAVLVGAVGLHVMKAANWIGLDPKKGSWGRNAVGGLIFGLGFAVLGYCPGIIAGAIGNGFVDAAVGGLAGILFGSWLLAVVYPRLEAGILGRGSFPALTLPGVLKVNEWVVIVPLSALILLLFYLLER